MKTRIIRGRLHLIYDPTTDDFHRSQAMLKMYQAEAEHRGEDKTLSRLRLQETKLHELRRRNERPRCSTSEADDS